MLCKTYVMLMIISRSNFELENVCTDYIGVQFYSSLTAVKSEIIN